MTKEVNLQDIIPDGEIVKLQNLEFADIFYESYRVQYPIWSDQIETLIEKGFMISINSEGHVIVNKALNPSPKQLSTNKLFWRSFSQALTFKEKSN